MPPKNDNPLYIARREKGFTQQEVADAVGITRVHYNRIEHGGGTTTETMRKICRLLGVKIIIQ